MSELLNTLQQYGNVDTDAVLQRMTTFRIGGKADFVVYPKNMIALAEVIQLLKKENIPFKVLGKGSNILCSDEDFHGVIIRLDRTFNEYYYNENMVVAQAGVSLIALAYDAMKRGLSGLEWACGIPGTVGGAIFMNAGAYKSSMKEIVTEVLIYRDGDFVWMSNEECGFDYRKSVFQSHPDWLVVAVRMQLQEGNINEIRELVDNRKARRMETQPLEYPSAGSVFRNPEGSFAWKYIDELGLRGKQIGGAQISSKHSNFIVNVGGACASDVMALVKMINDGMQERYGFTLKMEVEKFNWQD